MRSMFASLFLLNAVSLAQGQCEPEALASIGGRPNNVAMVGTTAFVANGFGGLVVYDVVDPSSPEVIGVELTTDRALDVVVEDGFAFLADRYFGLRVVDVSDPFRPVAVGELNLLPGSMWNIDTHDGIVYVANTDQGLQIVDVSDPLSPSLLATIEAEDVVDVRVRDGRAVFITFRGRMILADISDPSNPVLLSDEVLWKNSDALEVVGDLAFVAARDAGLSIVDISDSASPVIIGSFATPGDANHVSVVGGLAYVAQGSSFDRNSSVLVLDVSDATMPVLLGALPFLYAQVVEPVGGIAYVCDGFDGFFTVDVSDPTLPVSLSRIRLPHLAIRVMLQGDVAFIAEEGGVTALDVSNRRRPVPLDHYNSAGNENVARLHDRTMYLAKRSRGLEILDVSDPNALSLIGTYLRNDEEIRSVDFVGEVGLVSVTDFGLRVVDFSDPANPIEIAEHQMIGSPGIVRASGSLAFVGVDSTGLEIIDVSDPGSPRTLSRISLRGRLRDVVVRDGFAYVSVHTAVSILDISDPENPFETGLIDGIAAARMDTSGDRLFLAGEYQGLAIYDLSIPGEPELVEFMQYPNGSADVAIQDMGAYVADRRSGLTVLNIASCLDCPADFDGDGDADAEDFFFYLDLFASGDDRADLDGDGDLDGDDFVLFLHLFATPCE